MRYKVGIAPVERISSEITVFFDGKTMEFISGKEMSEHEFDKNYIIDKISAENDKVVIWLRGNERVNDVNWIKEKNINFF